MAGPLQYSAKTSDLLIGLSGSLFTNPVPAQPRVTLDFPDDLTVTWQSTFSNSHYGLGERFLGSHGTIERLAGTTDMVTGKSQTGIWYFPEKVNRPDGSAAKGVSEDVNHMANFIECVRSRKQPNAPVEIGYRSAVAAHMANLAYRRRERVTLDVIKLRPTTA